MTEVKLGSYPKHQRISNAKMIMQGPGAQHLRNTEELVVDNI